VVLILKSQIKKNYLIVAEIKKRLNFIFYFLAVKYGGRDPPFIIKNENKKESKKVQSLWKIIKILE